MTQVHPAGVVSEIVDRVCHKEQIGIWANELATALSLGDFLKEDWTFDDTVDLEKEIEAQLLDIIKSALTHPGYDLSGKLQAQADTIEAQAEQIEKLTEEKREALMQAIASDGQAQDAQSEIASLRSKLLAAQKALEPFVMHLDEMKFDLDNQGNELPDEQTVGWVYVTNGHFRTARATLNQIREVDGNKPS